MLKRLNSIEDDKLKMEKRLNEFERQEKDKESYLFKEEKSHNRGEELRRVQIKLMQEQQAEKYCESEVEDSEDESVSSSYVEVNLIKDSFEDSKPGDKNEE